MARMYWEIEDFSIIPYEWQNRDPFKILQILCCDGKMVVKLDGKLYLNRLLYNRVYPKYHDGQYVEDMLLGAQFFDLDEKDVNNQEGQ